MTLWINGDWVTGEGEQRVKTNPVGKEALWKGNDASAAQVEQACHAARRAFPAWAKQPFAVRQEIVEKFAGLLEANKAELTRIIASETSKPRWEAATEVTAMINKIAISVKAYHTRTGEQHTEMPDGAATLRHRPHGVLAVFGRTTSRGICRMATLCPRCWRAIPSSLNRASSRPSPARRWLSCGNRLACRRAC